MRDYWVLLGDLIRSRRMADRASVQTQVRSALRRINRSFRPHLLARLKVTRGDEIAGVFLDPSCIYDVVVSILESICPHIMRFTAARGPVTTGADTGDVSLMDGPAFHRAEELMVRQKRSGLYIFTFHSGADLLDEGVTLLANFVIDARLSWSARQRQMVEMYEKKQSQEKVARSLGVTQQTVSLTLRRARYFLVKAAEGWLRSQLSAYK